MSINPSAWEPSVRPALLLAMVACFSLSAAEQGLAKKASNTGTTKITVSNLKKKGYKCEVVSLGLTECAKTGSKTYWCSTKTTCTEKPRVHRPVRDRAGPAPIAGPVAPR